MKDSNKSGKEIMELYKNIKKAGITPEESMLFLLAHMEKTKAAEIGMDIQSDDGEIAIGGIDGERFKLLVKAVEKAREVMKKNEN